MPPEIRRFFRSPALHFVPGEVFRPEMPRVPDSRRGALAALIFTLLLVLAGVLLVHVLSRTATLQDCVMSGRTNCAPVTLAPDTNTP